jgi:hypothetical protein
VAGSVLRFRLAQPHMLHLAPVSLPVWYHRIAVSIARAASRWQLGASTGGMLPLAIRTIRPR